MNNNLKKIVIAGGSGFIGTALTHYFKKENCEVLVLTRGKTKEKEGVLYQNWDGKSFGLWQDKLENTDILINLTGKSVNCRFTEENKKELYSSRIDSVSILNQALLELTTPPKLFIQASGLGYYGDVKLPTDEHAPNGTDFLAYLTHAWEQTFFEVKTPSTRKIALRFGLVLGTDGGAMPKLVKLTKSFMGGAIGNGQTIMSWVQVAEINKIIHFLYNKNEMEGVFNLCSPHPITNKKFMKTLRSVFKQPFAPPVPIFIFKFVAKYLLQTEPDLLLTNQNCIPQRLIEAGYHFQYKNLDKTLIKMYYIEDENDNDIV